MARFGLIVEIFGGTITDSRMVAGGTVTFRASSVFPNVTEGERLKG